MSRHSSGTLGPLIDVPRGLRRAVLVMLTVLSLTQPARADSIVVWHSYRGAEEAALAQVARRYELSHAGVTIELLAIPYEAYASKLEAAIPHAHGPDLFIQAHQWIGPYLDEGLVVPLGDAFPVEDVSGFDPVAVRAVTSGAERYAVPLASKCVALYVNDRLVPDVPRTLEGITDLRLPSGVYPLAYQAQNAYYHSPLLAAFGGRLLDASNRFAFVGDAAARSLAFV